MSSVVIAGNTSGSVTLQAPAVAGTTVITLPTTNGTMIVGTGGVTGVAQGGTGLSSAGTAGNVLTSNGTAWVSQAAAAFDAGTRLAFQQTAAPTGWTKDTTAALNDSVMRIVTGAASSGGSTAFSTFNGQTATASYTLTTTDIPSHTHAPSGASNFVIANSGSRAVSTISGGSLSTDLFGASSTGSTGGGGGHSHGITTSIKYYDFIIASKN